MEEMSTMLCESTLEAAVLTLAGRQMSTTSRARQEARADEMIAAGLRPAKTAVCRRRPE